MDDSEPETMIFQPVGDNYDDVEFSFLKGFRKKQEKLRKEGAPSFDEPNCGLPVVSRDHVYDLTYRRRGKALILSNHEFKTLPPRQGNTEDVAKIVQTVKKLGFESILKQNCTAAEMMQELQTVASDIHWEADMFLCVIMSHGEVGGVCGTDGKPIPVNKLAAPFKGDKCRSLAGKPKLFFIQACRGREHDSGVPVEMTDGTTKYKKLTCSIPTSADFLFSYSTVEDHFAFLNKRRGSSYIQSLAEELEKCDGQTEICTVLQRVTWSVAFNFESNAADARHDKKKQCPSFTSTLTKQLYLSRKEK